MTGGYRSTDPMTSMSAAMAVDVAKLEGAVVRVLAEAGPAGLTVPEIADRLKVGRDSISPRMLSLVKQNLVFNTGKKRVPAIAGARRPCIVWAKQYEGSF